MSKSCVKVSIVIPVHNGEKVLRRCLDSILGQTYRDFELILVNDGSGDSSESICRKYMEQDSRIKLISKEQEGVSATRNRGIEEAVGEYIQFVDCDDYLASDYVETMVTEIEKKQADLVIAGIAENYFFFFIGIDLRRHFFHGSFQLFSKFFQRKFCIVFQQIEQFLFIHHNTSLGLYNIYFIIFLKYCNKKGA